jgi:hypothetical protein
MIFGYVLIAVSFTSLGYDHLALGEMTQWHRFFFQIAPLLLAYFAIGCADGEEPLVEPSPKWGDDEEV